jgi:predicted  nucleic acid-binding Zn-ribbon protein
MPIQPLEIYEVEETGELVLKHNDLREALVSHNVLMLVNHNDKEIVLWVGKGASTRTKFAGARSSRRFLTERSLSYRVKTCDEDDEPEWFQKLFEIKVARRSRDEPPSLEVLAILNVMKAEAVPDGFEREACIISRDFYVPVEHKASILGKDTTTIKFEKSSYLPEGFFILPSEAYRPRLLVRNGKIMGLDLLVKVDFSEADRPSEELQQEVKQRNAQLKELQQEGARKDQEIEELKQQILQKSQELKKKDSNIRDLQQKMTDQDQAITDFQRKGKDLMNLQDDNRKKTERIEALEKRISSKNNQIEEYDRELSEKNKLIEELEKELGTANPQIDSLKLDLAKKEQAVDELQQEISASEKMVETLKEENSELKSTNEKTERELANMNQRIEDLEREIVKMTKAIKEKESIIEEMDTELREKSRKIQELEMSE